MLHTRAELYTHEAQDILETLAQYGTLKTEQICRMFPPGKRKAIQALLKKFVKEKRLYSTEDGGLISAAPDIPVNDSMVRAFWVLLDLMDRVEYHAAGLYPVAICFFVNAEMYEIIPVPRGQEWMLTAALSHAPPEAAKRILVLDDIEQQQKLVTVSAVCCCLVASNGAVTYYQ